MSMSNPLQYNVLVGQSGGPTAVINSSLYGIITASHKNKRSISHVYGMIHGIEGFLEGHYMNLTDELDETDLELLKNTPAAYLGSCRYKLSENLSDKIYPILFQKFNELNIRYFLYIGGNDSMDTVSKLSLYSEKINSNIRIIGIPKTIDNDLVNTDHTPGFGSAAKYISSTVREIALDSSVYHNKSVTIVELMGRHAGWITAASVLARKYAKDNPVLVYLPEVPFDMEKFANDIKTEFTKKNNLVVCVSEGIRDVNGTFICEYGNDVKTDNFGHKMLTGCGKILENFVRDQFGIKVRSVEINISQRCSGIITSLTDINEAAMAGYYGIETALKGMSGQMIALNRLSSTPYKVECKPVDVTQVCNKEKPFPSEWITCDGTNIRKEFLEYIIPLIQGEPEIKMENGLPLYCYRK